MDLINNTDLSLLENIILLEQFEYDKKIKEKRREKFNIKQELHKKNPKSIEYYKNLKKNKLTTNNLDIGNNMEQLITNEILEKANTMSFVENKKNKPKEAETKENVKLK